MTIRRLEPGTDPAGLLVTGEIDFSIDGNSFEQVELVTNDVPVVSVAAIFQKDPIAVLAHPGAGISAARRLARPDALPQELRDLPPSGTDISDVVADLQGSASLVTVHSRARERSNHASLVCGRRSVRAARVPQQSTWRH